MNTAKKLLTSNDELTFENEHAIGLDEINTTPRIPWHEISLSYERINEIVLDAINEFKKQNK